MSFVNVVDVSDLSGDVVAALQRLFLFHSSGIGQVHSTNEKLVNDILGQNSNSIQFSTAIGELLLILKCRLGPNARLSYS